MEAVSPPLRIPKASYGGIDLVGDEVRRSVHEQEVGPAVLKNHVGVFAQCDVGPAVFGGR